MRLFLQFSILIIISSPLLSQNLFFRYGKNILVEQEGKVLRNPWAGGLNGAHISKLDLDNDGLEDLFVFDKVTGKVSTFIAIAENGIPYYKHDPKYERLLPLFRGWAIAADYNCDGKKDIFSSGNTGDVMVYKNISIEGGIIRLELVKKSILTEGLSGYLSLHIAQSDVPSISDIDEDGDLDIITFDASGGHTALLHKNQSQEKYGHCDSLDFKRIGTCWGRFMKGHSCTEVEFGIDCGTNEEMRVLHTGSTSLVLDLNGDNVKDLLIGSVECNNLLTLRNEGTSLDATFTSVTDTVPQSAVPNFPASFFLDVDFDGVKDLIVSSNNSSNLDKLTNLDESVYFYKNVGSENSPVFDPESNKFLQEERIDLGEYSYPALVDIDGDQDQDLLVGHRGKYHEDKAFYATLFLYENTGTKENAAFKLVDKDFLGFSNRKYENLKPFFKDLNGDGKHDFLFAFTDPLISTASLAYILNSASTGISVNLEERKSIDFSFNSFDSPLLFDVDEDGVLDLILGRTQGRIEYYKNDGTNLAPSFTLITDKFGGIQNSLSNLNPTPFVYNLDGSGKEELIVGDRSGGFKIFFEWKSEINSTFSNTPQFLLNKVAETYDSAFFGKETFPTAGDLNNDGMPELIIGTNGGGLILLTNETAIVNREDRVLPASFKVYPNPSNDVFIIESETGGSLEVYSLLGQVELKKQVLKSNKTSLNLKGIKRGFYILKFTTTSGASATKKIFKE